MAARNPTDLLNGHLALYTYLEPLWRGRSVLEVGAGDGGRAAHLAANGAGKVVAVDRDRGAIDRARVRFRRPRLEYRAVASWGEVGGAGAFDVVLVPDGETLLHDPGLIARLRASMSSLGRLVVAVRSAERRSPLWRGGVGYYELVDTLTTHFARVKMFGQTPFLGFGLVEFEGSPEAVRVETSLVDAGEAPCDYVAIAGVDDGPALGYALVQVPFTVAEESLSGGAESSVDGATKDSLRQAEAEVERLTRELQGVRTRAVPSPSGELVSGWEARLVQAERRADDVERRARARTEEDEARWMDLRRKLETAWSDAEAAQRIARAQSGEIEELRARVRRAQEDRATLDTELGSLRRALAEADESVVRLTRRTAEEMAAVAQRLSAGLLGTEEGAVERSKVHQQLAAAEEQIVTLRASVADAEGRAAANKTRLEEALVRLAEAEELASQLPARDDRIALLEGEKQDLTWRLSEAEARLARGANIAALQVPKAPLGASLPAPQPPPPRPAAEPEAPALPSPRLAELEAEVVTLRAARDRAVEEFHKVSAAHLQEVHRLRGQVSEQSALVSELEDQVRVAETRAANAEKELGAARAAAKTLDEADRARRSRLAELEGKLLRLQHEKKQATSDEGNEQLWQQRLQTSEQRTVLAVQQAAQATEALARASEEIAALREEARRLAEGKAAAEAKAEAEAEARAAADARVASEARLEEAQATAARVPTPLAGETRRALYAIEERLLEEAREVATLEATVSSLEAEVRARGSLTSADRLNVEERLAEKDAELVRQRQELAQVRRELELVANQAAAARLPLVSEISQEGVQVQLMHNTLTNIRRRAARLRDEVEGYRRRAEGLSPGAMSSILEEIGEDLAEFAKA